MYLASLPVALVAMPESGSAEATLLMPPSASRLQRLRRCVRAWAAELPEAWSDKTPHTIWWGDELHSLAVLWAPFLLWTAAGIPPLVVVLCVPSLLRGPWAVARRRRWARLGRQDPRLAVPKAAWAVFIVVFAALAAIALSGDLGVWAFVVALTAADLLLFTHGRARAQRMEEAASRGLP